MKRYRWIALAAAVLAGCTGPARVASTVEPARDTPPRAEVVLDTNSDSNQIESHVIESDGRLRPAPGSPYATGVQGAGWSPIVAQNARHTLALVHNQGFTGWLDSSVFKIEGDGSLRLTQTSADLKYCCWDAYDDQMRDLGYNGDAIFRIDEAAGRIQQLRPYQTAEALRGGGPLLWHPLRPRVYMWGWDVTEADQQPDGTLSFVRRVQVEHRLAAVTDQRPWMDRQGRFLAFCKQSSSDRTAAWEIHALDQDGHVASQPAGSAPVQGCTIWTLMHPGGHSFYTISREDYSGVTLESFVVDADLNVRAVARIQSPARTLLRISDDGRFLYASSFFPQAYYVYRVSDAGALELAWGLAESIKR